MIKVSITEYKTNNFGEIDKSIPAKVTFETLGLSGIYDLFQFEKLLNAGNKVRINYENGTKYVSIVGKDFRKYIKII
ncbi:MAG: hypothetical protein IJW64_00505 [Clostridia bacterium]|nr:hypothetical protein [Clostridia bacterium]